MEWWLQKWAGGPGGPQWAAAEGQKRREIFSAEVEICKLDFNGWRLPRKDTKLSQTEMANIYGIRR